MLKHALNSPETAAGQYGHRGGFAPCRFIDHGRRNDMRALGVRTRDQQICAASQQQSGEQPRGNAREHMIHGLCALRLQIDKWCAIQAIKPPHAQRGSLDRQQFDHRRSDRGLAAPASGAQTCRWSARYGTASAGPGRAVRGASSRAPGPACAGQCRSGLRASAHPPRSSRPARRDRRAWATPSCTRHGVRIVPMKYTPASVPGGSAIATSPGRSALSSGSSFIGGQWREQQRGVQGVLPAAAEVEVRGNAPTDRTARAQGGQRPLNFG